MIGYGGQYGYAAKLIYKALLQGDLDSVKVADPDAGRVDDIQLFRGTRLDAYQVKWSEYIGSFTTKNLIAESAKGDIHHPSLIRQLAEGWTLLKTSYPDRIVRVHLVVRGVPSVNDKAGVGSKVHFQAFLRECWDTRSEWFKSPETLPPSKWINTFKAIQIASGLNADAFYEFSHNCFFLFEQGLDNGFGNREEYRRTQDITDIANLLQRTAGVDTRVVEISRDNLLEALGWKRLFSCRFKHEFFVNEVLYQPIQSTIEELESSIATLDRGYIILLGTPGSGKSTTLTQTFRYRPKFRIVKYYAFVRDDSSLGRGEANNFFNDLYFSIQRDLSVWHRRSHPQCRDELLEAFHLLLSQLSDDWKKHEIKTLILVDGLDHIEREQNPVRSLVADLPHPDNIPEGIVFVLGSQKAELSGISPRLLEHFKEPRRTIRMDSLPPGSVHSIIDASQMPLSLSNEQRQRIVTLSDGHPLALSYLLKKLHQLSCESEVDSFLCSKNPYSGHIEQDYEIYWKGLANNEILRDLLALMCRVRGVIDLNIARTWSGEDAVRRLIAHASHFFHRETETRWIFFHNSFQQFLLIKTSTDLFNQPDLGKNAEYHRILADSAASVDPSLPWAWEHIYHRAQAGDTQQVLDLFTQDLFRNQFYSLRAVNQIFDDISLCLEIAANEGISLYVLRAILLQFELGERNSAMEDIDLPKILLDTKGVDVALDAIARGRELLVNKSQALSYCYILLQRGEQAVARRIFDLSEPYEELSGINKIERYHDADNVLRKWVNIAHYFRPLETIFSAIEKLELNIDFHFAASASESDIQKQQATDNLRHILISDLSQSIYKDNNAEKLETLKSILSNYRLGDFFLSQIDFMTADAALSKKTSLEKGINALDRILRSFSDSLDDATVSDRIAIAEYCFHLKNNYEEVEKSLAGLSQPPLVGLTGHHSSEGLNVYWHRISLNRLFSALGRPVDPIEAVPNSSRKEQEDLVIFERLLVLAANLWGEAWRTNTLSPNEVLKILSPALSFFNRQSKDVRDWSNWHMLRSMHGEFIIYLIHAASTHGIGARDIVVKEVYRQWEDDRTKNFWHADIKRYVALELFRMNGCVEDLTNLLTKLDESVMSADDEPIERLSQCHKQIEAWIEANEPEKARTLLSALFQASFGVSSHKDHRFEQWVDWVAKVSDEAAVDIIPRMKPFIAAQNILYSNDRHDAAGKLIAFIAKHHPSWALEIRQWLMKNNGAPFIESIEGVLCGLASRPNWSDARPLLLATAHLVVPFQRYFNDSLAISLGRLVGQLHGSYSQSTLAYLENAIMTKAFPSIRRAWREGLKKGLEQSGVDCVWLEEAIHHQESDGEATEHKGLYLHSGEFLSASEISRRTSSFDALVSLLDEVKESWKFSWSPVLKHLSNSLSLDQVHTLLRHATIQDSFPTSIILVNRLRQLGHIHEAKRLLNSLYTEKPSPDWYRNHGGGHRLQIASMIIAFDVDHGRKEALKLFTSDFLGSYLSSGMILLHFEEIADVLFDDIPTSAIWHEVEEHIHQLAEFKLAKHMPPAPSRGVDQHDLAYLIDLLFEQLDNPTSIMRHEALNGIGHLALTGLADQELFDRLEPILSDTKQINKEIYLAVIDSVSVTCNDFVKRFASSIVALSGSPCMATRLLARHIAAELQLHLPPIQEDRRQLPFIYRIEFCRAYRPDRSVTFDRPPPGQVLPDTTDPFEMIRSHNDAFDFLSYISSIPLETLVHRAVQLMSQLQPQDTWDKQAEQRIFNQLSSLQFKVAYRRPRVIVAHYAFSHIVAELVDAEVIDAHSLNALLHFLVSFDCRLTLLNPVPRPEWLPIPQCEEIGNYPRKDWNLNPKKSEEQFYKWMRSNHHVLAERSRFVRGDRDKPTERREAVICQPHHYNPKHSIFPGLPYCLPREYPSLHNMPVGHAQAMAISGMQYFIETEWLAFCPNIAHQMGWNNDESGLFRWVDTEGNIMVESTFWQDGCLAYADNFGRDQLCSCGWIVTATPNAAEQLHETFPDWIQMVRVNRSLQER